MYSIYIPDEFGIIRTVLTRPNFNKHNYPKNLVTTTVCLYQLTNKFLFVYVWVNVKMVAEEVMVLNVESYRVILSCPASTLLIQRLLQYFSHLITSSSSFSTLVLSQSTCTLLFFFFFLIIARQIVLIEDQIREYLKNIVQVILDLILLTQTTQLYHFLSFKCVYSNF